MNNAYVPEQLQVLETESEKYPPRTRDNARSAHLTVALAEDFETLGEKLTRKEAGERYLAIHLQMPVQEAADLLFEDMKRRNARILNVAGNGIYTLAPMGWTQGKVDAHLHAILSKVHERWPLHKVISGGQTGVDMAGVTAAHALGIPVRATLPNGFRQRHLGEWKDRIQTREDIVRQIVQGAAKLGPAATSRNAPASSSVVWSEMDSARLQAAAPELAARIHPTTLKRFSELWDGLDGASRQALARRLQAIDAPEEGRPLQLHVRVVSKRKERIAIVAQPGETVVDVSRRNPVLGNRHEMADYRDDAERVRVLAKFKKDLDDDIARNGPMSRELRELAARALAGEKLALECWCAPRCCHADYLRQRIFEFANVPLPENEVRATNVVSSPAQLSLIEDPETMPPVAPAVPARRIGFRRK